MFPKCENCGSRTLFPLRFNSNVFCSLTCKNFFQHPGFCADCISETDEIPADSTFQLNGIGDRFWFPRDICKTCNSSIQTRFLTFLWVPLLPLDKYRILQIKPGFYVGRKLRISQGEAINSRLRKVNLNRIAIAATAAVTVFAMLFPPFYINLPGGWQQNLGYDFLFTPPTVGSVVGRVDVSLLAIELAVIWVTGTLCWFLAHKATKQPD